MFHWLLRKFIGKLFSLPVRRQLARFEAATHKPRQYQEALLRRFLTYHQRTAFGREHRFQDIRTPADFQRQLPVARYEYFEPYIARMRRGERNVLVADCVVHTFAL